MRINECGVLAMDSLSGNYGLDLNGKYGRVFVIMFSDNTTSASEIHFKILTHSQWYRVYLDGPSLTAPAQGDEDA